LKKILIVDDEKSFLLSLKDGLETHSDKYEVLTAENGRDAIEILRSTMVDLLVTDLKMPEMNGFELLAWVSRHQPQLPVIVMSAFGTPEIEARLEKMDTLQFLDKPLDIQMLEEGIANGLDAGGKSFIRGITLATFLQLMNVEKKNCTLKVINADRFAYLYINQGELIDAELEDLSGLDAAMEIVGWMDAEIEMDGICRRQEIKINVSLEHLLLEAFRLKDESAEEEKSGSATKPEAKKVPAPEAKKAVVAAATALTETLTKLAAVQEFVIFDDKQKLQAINSGKCSLQKIDPNRFAGAIAAMSRDMKVGACRFIVFNRGRRNRCLLFQHQSYMVMAKVKPGTSPAQLVTAVNKKS